MLIVGGKTKAAGEDQAETITTSGAHPAGEDKEFKFVVIFIFFSCIYNKATTKPNMEP